VKKQIKENTRSQIINREIEHQIDPGQPEFETSSEDFKAQFEASKQRALMLAKEFPESEKHILETINKIVQDVSSGMLSLEDAAIELNAFVQDTSEYLIDSEVAPEVGECSKPQKLFESFRRYDRLWK
jgi:hypothetical protein